MDQLRTRFDIGVSTMIIILALFIVILMIGEMDARDQERHEEFYCAMVAEGSWPAYNEDIDCD